MEPKQGDFSRQSKKYRIKYLDELKNLYGDGGGEAPVKAENKPVAPRSKKTPGQTIPKEAEEQIRFVTWLGKQGIRVSASANGGSRNLLEAMKMKRMGVSAGFPDVEIPLPSGPYHGLYIEMKRQKGGRLTIEQEGWLNYLNGKGYMAVVANGFEKAKEIFNHYMSFTNPTK